MSLSNTPEHRTEDLAFAAFLRVKGYPLIRVEKLTSQQNSKRCFIFEVPTEAMQTLKLEYVNSELLRFYNEIIGLKKL